MEILLLTIIIAEMDINYCNTVPPAPTFTIGPHAIPRSHPPLRSRRCCRCRRNSRRHFSSPSVSQTHQSHGPHSPSALRQIPRGAEARTIFQAEVRDQWCSESVWRGEGSKGATGLWSRPHWSVEVWSGVVYGFPGSEQVWEVAYLVAETFFYSWSCFQVRFCIIFCTKMNLEIPSKGNHTQTKL